MKCEFLNNDVFTLYVGSLSRFLILYDAILLEQHNFTGQFQFGLYRHCKDCIHLTVSVSEVIYR